MLNRGSERSYGRTFGLGARLRPKRRRPSLVTEPYSAKRLYPSEVCRFGTGTAMRLRLPGETGKRLKASLEYQPPGWGDGFSEKARDERSPKRLRGRWRKALVTSERRAMIRPHLTKGRVPRGTRLAYAGRAATAFRRQGLPLPCGLVRKTGLCRPHAEYGRSG
jgi:hypothetical protein